jgi:arsenical pump membrane protein
VLARLGWLALALGGPSVVAAALLDHQAAGAAVGQDWPPFVLVTGLLLIGVVARAEGLFELGGGAIARIGRTGPALLLCCAVLVAAVTVTLNLDTSVTFLTPVVLAAARRQGRDPEPFMYLVIWMSNGSSLLLPGSNLTNLIVLQHTHGAAFVARTAAPWAASVVAVVVVVGLLYRRRGTPTQPGDMLPAAPIRLGFGALGVALAVAAMLTLPAAGSALVVFGVGWGLTTWRLGWHRVARAELAQQLNVPLLLGLFAAACALGTLGRSWSAPAHLLSHQGIWPAAGVGAGFSVVVNNLPAASLLAARGIAHPVALLIGLNLGPNLVLWGSLAGVLWFQASRSAGWHPSIRRYSILGAAVVPVTMAASLGALTVVR